MHENSLQNLVFYKKGQSGNLNGCPRGKKKKPQLKKWLREILEGEVEIQDKNGRIVKYTGNELIMRTLIKKAADGDVRAIALILQYTEGMPVQPVRREGEGGNVIIEINIPNADQC